MIINEDSRSKLVADSKRGKRERDGKTRFEKRLKSHVAGSTRQYNKIDMNQLFKKGIISIAIDIKGETDAYQVRLSYGGVLDSLHDELKRTQATKLELKHVIKALVIAFNKGDVYIHCSCPDFKYRFSYWATVNKISSGKPELRPADQTNPDDDLGPACKHILLVLSNTSWLIKVASVIKNYITYMETHMESMFAKIIYPAVFSTKYEKPVQTTMFDKDDLDSEEADIDKSNNDARKRGQFKPGNEHRFVKDDTPSEDQETFLDDESNNTEET